MGVRGGPHGHPCARRRGPCRLRWWAGGDAHGAASALPPCTAEGGSDWHGWLHAAATTNRVRGARQSTPSISAARRPTLAFPPPTPHPHPHPQLAASRDSAGSPVSGRSSGTSSAGGVGPAAPEWELSSDALAAAVTAADARASASPPDTAPAADALTARLAALAAFGNDGGDAADVPPLPPASGAFSVPERSASAGAGPLPGSAGSGSLADLLGGAPVPPPGRRTPAASGSATGLAELWAAGDAAATAAASALAGGATPPTAPLASVLAAFGRPAGTPPRPPPTGGGALAGAGTPPPPLPPTAADVRAIIDRLPLDADAGTALEHALPPPTLASLDPSAFADALALLAAGGAAFRAWQLFDWARHAPPASPAARLATAPAYVAMVDACGGWQQLRQALDLVAEMRSRGLADGGGAAAALLRAALRAGDAPLACEAHAALAAAGAPRHPPSVRALVDVAARAGAADVALAALDDLRVVARASGLPRVPHGDGETTPRPPPPPPTGEPPPLPHLDAPAYNAALVCASRGGDARRALAVYRRMAADGVPPNTKTFTALLTVVGRDDAGLDAVAAAIPPTDADAARAAYGGALAACEKAGHWDAASGLFDRMRTAGVPADAAAFNSVIAACAHGGEAGRARAAFDAMADAGVVPDAVSHANLIRAYKKAGAWADAAATYEAMLAAGCTAHAAVVSSVVDTLWATGVGWARAKAASLHGAALAAGALPAPTELAKKGTLKVDVQALTAGAAVLGAAAWLRSARAAAAVSARGALTGSASAGVPPPPCSLDAARKVVLVNGGGEHARAQGHAATVRDAVAATLAGGGAPFRAAPDHARTGRLEAPAPALRKWLLSPAFDAYHDAVCGGGGGAADARADATTAECAAADAAADAEAADAHAGLAAIEARHAPSLSSLAAAAPLYLQQRDGLVAAAAHAAAALGASPAALHAAVGLMDRVMATGVRGVTGQLHSLFVAACLRVAARTPGRGPEPPLALAAAAALYPPAALERMEANVAACVHGDVDAAPALDWLALYATRLGADVADPASRRAAAGAAFAAAGDALRDVVLAQQRPSLVAAALMAAGRRAVGALPAWPSVLSTLTGYTEAGTPALAAAEALAARIIARQAGGGGGGAPPVYGAPPPPPPPPPPAHEGGGGLTSLFGGAYY